MTYWLLGFGCGIILSGIMGTIFSLNITQYTRDLNNNKEISVVKENNRNQIEKIETDSLEEYKTEKYGKKTTNVEQESSDIETIDYAKVTSENVEVYIPSQSMATDIAEILEAAGIIENSSTFVNFMKEKKKTTKLKSGKIIFSKNLSYEEILEILAHD